MSVRRASFLVPEGHIYLIGEPVDCRVVVEKGSIASNRDWVGLFPYPLPDIGKYLSFEWVVSADIDEGSEDDESGKEECIVRFRRGLPQDDTANQYCFAYISNSQPLAVSAPFHFRNYQCLPANMKEVQFSSMSSLSSFVGVVPKKSLPEKNFPQGQTPLLNSSPPPTLRKEVLDAARPGGELLQFPSTTSSFEVINELDNPMKHLSLLSPEEKLRFDVVVKVNGHHDNQHSQSPACKPLPMPLAPSPMTNKATNSQQPTVSQGIPTVPSVPDAQTGLRPSSQREEVMNGEEKHSFANIDNLSRAEERVESIVEVQASEEAASNGPPQSIKESIPSPALPANTIGVPCVSVEGFQSTNSANVTPVSPHTVRMAEPPVTIATSPTSVVKVTSCPVETNRDLPSHMLESRQLPGDILKESSFTDRDEFKRVQQFINQLNMDYKQVKQAYQRERMIAKQAENIGEALKKTAESNVLRLSELEKDLMQKEQLLAAAEETKRKLQVALHDKQNQLSKTAKSEAELKETKHRLKKVLQRRDDEVRIASDEKEDLRLQLSHSKQELDEIGQAVHAQRQKTLSGRLARNLSGEENVGLFGLEQDEVMTSSVSALVIRHLKSMEDQIARQNEALLVMQEERVQEQRRFEEERKDLLARCRESEEKAQQAEAMEGDHVRTIENFAERHRQNREEIASLRRRLQSLSERQSGQSVHSMPDQPNPGSVQYEATSPMSHPAVQVAPKAALRGSSHTAPQVSNNTASASVHNSDSSTDPEEAPPIGLKCPVCGRESSTYLTMRMWQWHVNGHFAT